MLDRASFAVVFCRVKTDKISNDRSDSVPAQNTEKFYFCPFTQLNVLLRLGIDRPVVGR
jgi:hypothetical protein